MLLWQPTPRCCLPTHTRAQEAGPQEVEEQVATCGAGDGLNASAAAQQRSRAAAAPIPPPAEACLFPCTPGGVCARFVPERNQLAEKVGRKMDRVVHRSAGEHTWFATGAIDRADSKYLPLGASARVCVCVCVTTTSAEF